MGAWIIRSQVLVISWLNTFINASQMKTDRSIRMKSQGTKVLRMMPCGSGRILRQWKNLLMEGLQSWSCRRGDGRSPSNPCGVWIGVYSWSTGSGFRILKLRERNQGLASGGWEGVWGGLESELIWGLLFEVNRKEMPRFKDSGSGRQIHQPKLWPSEAYLVSRLLQSLRQSQDWNSCLFS